MSSMGQHQVAAPQTVANIARESQFLMQLLALIFAANIVPSDGNNAAAWPERPTLQEPT
jgi:hypothetical protein